MTTGTSPTTFAPDNNTTRGQLVTFLWRMAGSPQVGTAHSFTDVPSGRYFSTPVAWAHSNNIVEGLNPTTFGTDRTITREELAAMLFRYVRHIGEDTSASSGALNGFTDRGSVSGWATEYMRWAATHGILGNGTNQLNPRGNTQRAHTVASLHRVTYISGPHGIEVTATPSDFRAQSVFAANDGDPTAHFQLHGIPADVAAGITIEQVHLGGFFSGLEVTGIRVLGGTSLQVSIADPEADTLPWSGYNFDDGFIIIGPCPRADREGFAAIDYYYWARVDVTRPGVVANTPAIPKAADLSIRTQVAMELVNDSFNAPVTAGDIQIEGGFVSVSIENLTQDGDTVAFTVVGETDGNFGLARFTIPGDFTASGLSVSTTLRIGRVPLPVQNWRFETNTAEQQLNIFMYYDEFTADIDLSMLSFGGVMNRFDVVSLERVYNFNISLTVRGSVSEPGTGTITFAPAAVRSGAAGLTADIFLLDPSNMHANIANIATLGVGAEPPELGVTVTAVLSLVGKKIAGEVAKAAASAAMGAIANALGFGDPDPVEMHEEVMRELDNISNQMESNQAALMARFDQLSMDVATTSMVNYLNALDKLFNEYLGVVSGVSRGGSAYSRYTGAMLEEWYMDNMTWPTGDYSNSISGFRDNLEILLNYLELTLDGNGAVTKNPYSNLYSLYILFERQTRSMVPFEHNLIPAMKAYVEQWDALIAMYLSLFADATDHNYRLWQANPTDARLEYNFNHMQNLLNSVSARYVAIATNIDAYIAASAYYAAYNELFYYESDHYGISLRITLTGRGSLPIELRWNPGGTSSGSTHANASTMDTDAWVMHGRGKVAKYRQYTFLDTNYYYYAVVGEVDGYGRIVYNKNYFYVQRMSKGDTLYIEGKPRDFWEHMKFIREETGSSASLNQMLDTYLVDLDMENGGVIRERWFFESGPGKNLLYFGWNERSKSKHEPHDHYGMHKLGFFRLDGDSWSSIEEHSSNRVGISDGTGGFTTNDRIATISFQGANW